MFFSEVSLALEFSELDRLQGVVEEYRELRRQCAKSDPHMRVGCFRQLNEKNGEYKDAKRAIAEQKPSNLGNLHLVSHVY